MTTLRIAPRVSALTPVTVEWDMEGIPAYDDHWVGLFTVEGLRVLSDSKGNDAWTLTHAAQTGTFTIAAPTMLGSYHFRYLRSQTNLDDIAAVGLPFEVVASPAQPAPPDPPPPQPPPPVTGLEAVLGPVARLGAYPRFDAFRDTYLRGTYALYPQGANVPDSIYYDFPWVMYQAYYTTGDLFYRDAARRMAIDWRDDVINTAWWQVYHEGREYGSAPGLSGRTMSTLGLFALALDTGDAYARELVNIHARFADENVLGLFNGETRDAGYWLMAQAASTALGDDHRVGARRIANLWLDTQDTHHPAFPTFTGDPGCANMYAKPWYSALLMEGLVRIDRVDPGGNSRILPGVKRAMDWLIANAWDGRSFQYSINSRCEGEHHEPFLNGLYMPALGYLWHRTGQDIYRTVGDEALDAMLDIAEQQNYNGKFAGEFFRGSASFVGATR